MKFEIGDLFMFCPGVGVGDYRLIIDYSVYNNKEYECFAPGQDKDQYNPWLVFERYIESHYELVTTSMRPDLPTDNI